MPIGLRSGGSKQARHLLSLGAIATAAATKTTRMIPKRKIHRRLQLMICRQRPMKTKAARAKSHRTTRHHPQPLSLRGQLDRRNLRTRIGRSPNQSPSPNRNQTPSLSQNQNQNQSPSPSQSLRARQTLKPRQSLTPSPNLNQSPSPKPRSLFQQQSTSRSRAVKTPLRESPLQALLQPRMPLRAL